MGRPTRGESFVSYLEDQVREALKSGDLTGAERANLINAGIKLIDVRRGVADDSTQNFFGKDK